MSSLINGCTGNASPAMQTRGFTISPRRVPESPSNSEPREREGEAPTQEFSRLDKKSLPFQVSELKKDVFRNLTRDHDRV